MCFSEFLGHRFPSLEAITLLTSFYLEQFTSVVSLTLSCNVGPSGGSF